jgi:hypothetical protein
MIALALRGDIPDATLDPYWAFSRDERMKKWYFDCYGANGGWSEGIDYMSYGLSNDLGTGAFSTLRR